MLPYARRLASRALTRAVILCYHRVADAPDDPQGLAVHPDRFQGHLEVLRQSGRRVVSLSELVAAAAGGRIPPGAVAISFDDGYADNLFNAAPRLAAAGLPATVFVASGWIGTRRMAWWDEVALHLHGEDDSAYRALLARMPGMAFDEREKVLAKLRERSGHDGSTDDGHRALSDAELTELSGQPGIEIGAHTRHHPSLARRPAAEQEEEVRACRLDLAERLGSRPALFAYPFGARGRDYDRTTMRSVAAAGFDAAVSTDPGPVSRLSPGLELPRVLVGDLDSDAFAARLRRAFAL